MDQDAQHDPEGLVLLFGAGQHQAVHQS
jgi:hypothetical protein